MKGVREAVQINVYLEFKAKRNGYEHLKIVSSSGPHEISKNFMEESKYFLQKFAFPEPLLGNIKDLDSYFLGDSVR